MDLRINAASISTRIKEIFPNERYFGKVEGVYTKAANFSFGSYLITAADTAQENLPYGILCDFSKIELKQVLHSDDPAEIDAQSLRIGIGSFEIAFRGVTEWSPEFRLTIEKKDIPCILANAGTIEQEFKQNKPMEGLGSLIKYIPQIMGNVPANENQFSILEHTAFIALRIVIDAMRTRDENTLESAIKSLIGLGIGLTPSGDDVLAGLFGTLLITMKESDRSWIENDFQKTIKHISGLTTDVSLSTLTAASEGYYAERFSSLVAAIIRSKDPKEIDTPLKELLRWGSSSGGDTLLGMLIGFNLAVERLGFD
jgi:hypothetical protein